MRFGGLPGGLLCLAESTMRSAGPMLFALSWENDRKVSSEFEAGFRPTVPFTALLGSCLGGSVEERHLFSLTLSCFASRLEVSLRSRAHELPSASLTYSNFYP